MNTTRLNPLHKTIGSSVAVALLAAAAVVGMQSSGHGANHDAHGGAPRLDRHATRGVSDGKQSSTEKGLPPIDRQAKALTKPAREAPAKRGGTHEEEEVENGAGVDPQSTNQLKYLGGAVQTAPRIYLVLWGASWTTNGDPYGVANRLHYFYDGIGGSSIANVLKQYSGSTGAFTNPRAQYKGWLRDTAPVPASPTKTDIANAAARAAVKMNDISYNAQYIIATPWGVRDQYSIAKEYCGWHSLTSVTGRAGWTTYTSMPYIPYEDYLGVGCGGGQVHGATNGKLDGVTILASHEYAESVSDPGLNAWKDSDGWENADKCSWQSLADKTLSNGKRFPVQPSWSNYYRVNYSNGCLFSS